MKIMHIIGARPNYMKVAPIVAEMAKQPHTFRQVCVHTGQHYDHNMSEIFFSDLGMPQPDYFLGVGSGSHAAQTARVMLAFEPVVLEYQPDWVVVVGDVNSTLACSLVCSKLGIRVAHVEAGLRSRDRSMPEEINRILTDHLADLLFTPSSDGDENLLQEGITPEKIHLVGNVMIDSLARMLPGIHRSLILEEVGLSAGGYVLATLHRPGNVDDPARLTALMETLQKISAKIPLVFPVHPRTRKQLAELNLATPQTRLHLLEPLGYLDFVALMKTARLVLTDSGGIQEETTYLGVPCLTVRPNTERPVTIALGTNRLVESTPQAILDGVEAILSGQVALPGRIPPLWDGKAAKRIVNIFRQL